MVCYVHSHLIFELLNFVLMQSIPQPTGTWINRQISTNALVFSEK